MRISSKTCIFVSFSSRDIKL